mmetsp:Transcript_17104/g.51717  ORF Transcript_17104/g.51717 Transcript_17104/m.51717 type:complete len:99 (-) Transcript_17104:514-810(-)|eukprot:scaffold266433_cov35-Tisochrysis_lutea.AAC.6
MSQPMRATIPVLSSDHSTVLEQTQWIDILCGNGSLRTTWFICSINLGFHLGVFRPTRFDPCDCPFINFAHQFIVANFEVPRQPFDEARDAGGYRQRQT